jgi:hypothetical protein
MCVAMGCCAVVCAFTRLLPTPADARSVSLFLRECQGLDKVIIGEYISEPPTKKYEVRSHGVGGAVGATRVVQCRMSACMVAAMIIVFGEVWRLEERRMAPGGFLVLAVAGAFLTSCGPVCPPCLPFLAPASSTPRSARRL